MSKFSIILVLSFSLVSAMMGKTQRKLEHTNWQPNAFEGEKIVKGIDVLAKTNQAISATLKNIDDKNTKQQTQVQELLKAIEVLLLENGNVLKDISHKLDKILNDTKDKSNNFNKNKQTNTKTNKQEKNFTKKSKKIMDKTFVIFKPDCMKLGLYDEVKNRLLAEKFEVIAEKEMQLTDDLLKKHYAHIADKPFFPEILEFMKSSKVRVMVLSGENIVARMRDLLGPTDSTIAPKGTIRGDYGKDKMHNILHASDSDENALIEIDRFFSKEEQSKFAK